MGERRNGKGKEWGFEAEGKSRPSRKTFGSVGDRVDECKEESNLIPINEHICRTEKGRHTQSLQRRLS